MTTLSFKGDFFPAEAMGNRVLAITGYYQTSDIRYTLVGNNIVHHSDVVGASLFGAVPTTSSFSTEHVASVDSAKTTARRDDKYLSVGISAAYIRCLIVGVDLLPALLQVNIWTNAICETYRHCCGSAWEYGFVFAALIGNRNGYDWFAFTLFWYFSEMYCSAKQLSEYCIASMRC